MKLYIKYMVSHRCKMAVKAALKELGLHFIVVDLGEVEIMGNLSAVQQEQLKIALGSSGLELMDDKRAILIGKIKSCIDEMVYHRDEMIKTNFSDYLSKKLDQNYAVMSSLFSEVQGTTIEQYIILHKIERVKELILYGTINISEIACKMNYSSTAHLSNQFKKSTGLTPSHFRKLRNKKESQVTGIDD